MSPEAIDALVAAGVSAEQLAAALKAEARVAEADKAERRAKAAERQRRSRMSRRVTVTERDTALQGVTERDPPSLNASPALTTTVENNLNPSPTPPIVPPAQCRSAWWPRDGFDRFWRLYPKRVAKDAAERAFRKLERRVDLTFDELMAGVQRFVDSEPDPKFIPHPASWLNAGQWADEIPPKAPANVTRFGGRNVPEARDANLAATALHQWTLAEDERDRGAPLLQIGRG